MNPIEISYISTPATAKVILVVEGDNDNEIRPPWQTTVFAL
jgi:hypothetical protein